MINETNAQSRQSAYQTQPVNLVDLIQPKFRTSKCNAWTKESGEA